MRYKALCNYRGWWCLNVLNIQSDKDIKFKSMQKIYILIVVLLLVSSITKAQDNQRYMALSLVNTDYRNNQIDQIQKAADIGMNAVIITVRWDVIYQLKANAANPWGNMTHKFKLPEAVG